MSRPSLRGTQEIFWDLVTAPRGVRAGLEEVSDVERRLPGGLETLIVSDERMGAVERLDVYANMYFYRLLDVLREDFPAVVAVTGDTRFHNLVTDYLLVHPSTSPSLRDLGRYLPELLKTHDVSEVIPVVPDLARLEWTLHDVFDGPDAEPLDASTMSSLAPEEWAAVRFGLVPTLRVLRFRFPVHEVWKAVTEGASIPDAPPARTVVRVWRKGFSVRHRVVEAAEEAALDAVLAGEDFGAVCETVAAVTTAEEAAPEAARILQTWFADGLVVGPTIREAAGN